MQMLSFNISLCWSFFSLSCFCPKWFIYYPLLISFSLLNWIYGHSYWVGLLWFFKFHRINIILRLIATYNVFEYIPDCKSIFRFELLSLEFDSSTSIENKNNIDILKYFWRWYQQRLLFCSVFDWSCHHLGINEKFTCLLDEFRCYSHITIAATNIVQKLWTKQIKKQCRFIHPATYLHIIQ